MKRGEIFTLSFKLRNAYFFSSTLIRSSAFSFISLCSLSLLSSCSSSSLTLQALNTSCWFAEQAIRSYWVVSSRRATAWQSTEEIISELTLAAVSERVFLRSHSNENVYHMHVRFHGNQTHCIRMALKWGKGQLRNGLSLIICLNFYSLHSAHGN